ncbi:hypothetical protein SDC9_181299 [bioreactor metagenome]|uniref:Bacterial Ig-like domain-containing protein n=1 Tax=bioreactor metagenome TaxID=1076179 RepID=A0A645H465_9ZZZZ
MKRGTVFAAAILLLVLAAFYFQGNRQEATPYDEINTIQNVSMAVKEGSVTPIGLTFTITDRNQPPYSYGEWYVIERKSDGAWVSVPVVVKGDYGFNDIAYLITGNTLELAVNWEWLYGKLEKGEYRMVKNIYDNGAYRYYDAKFTIGDGR